VWDCPECDASDAIPTDGDSRGEGKTREKRYGGTQSGVGSAGVAPNALVSEIGT